MDSNPPHDPRNDYPAPDPARPYVYPDTQVLINHFGIRSMVVLQRVIDTVAALQGDRLRNDPIAGRHNLEHLCAIHRVLFQDVFAWAGRIRTVDTEKQGQDFVLAADIPGRFGRMHDELGGENFLRGLGPEAFADRLAHYWYETYRIHPFRDGNSRAMRHFFPGLAAEAGYRLDFTAVDPSALLAACRDRYFEDDTEPLRACLRRIACRA